MYESLKRGLVQAIEYENGNTQKARDEIITVTSKLIWPAEERISKAVDLAWRYAQIGGDHHKMWVIDQMLRILFETEEDYNSFVAEYEEDGEYDWDVGIAP